MPNPDDFLRKHHTLVVIVNSILNDEKLRRLAPLSVEMLEDEMRRYRAIEAAVAQEMARDLHS